MKTIEPITIWDNGKVMQGSILNAYAVNVSLNQSAIFYYGIYAKNEDGSIGEKLKEAYNLNMPTEQYLQWDQDEFAWDFVASALNLVITGDYVAPQPLVVEEPILEAAPIEASPVQENTEETPSNSL